jgi:hypothetical protein
MHRNDFGGGITKFSVASIDEFRIKSESGATFYGGDQYWYSMDFKRGAACGATTCANILAYFARTRKELSGFFPVNLYSRVGFIEFMEEVYPFVKPGIGGIMAGDFIKGLTEYSSSRAVEFAVRKLVVPASRNSRPTAKVVGDFIANALVDDIPVAFLNLSNGRVQNLDSYHWVTIVSLDTDTMDAEIVDNGHLLKVDIGKWLRQSALGGAFVVVYLRK